MLLKKIKEVVIAWVVRRIVSRTNHRGQTHWLMRLLPPTRSVEIELTRIGGKRFLDMIENADKDSGSRRRKRRTGRKWHQLMQRCERASQVFGSKTPETIESKWHIKMQGANGCLSNYADDELMELKLAIIENEQSYIQELDVLYIQAKEVLRWHHILPRFNRQCITKNLQKLKINAVTIEERVTSVQHSNLETLLQAMDEILNEKFISYLLIYCENIGELRELFKQKMRKDSEFCRLLFSSYFQIERSLLPIHRISKLQTLLKEILELLSPNNHLNNSRLYNQALLLEAKLSEIVNRCHEVTRSILGSNYMNNILQALFPFDLKLPNHFEKSEIAEKNCKDLNVFVENGLKYGHSSDLKSFTEEILTSYKSLYQGSKEDLSTQNLCEDTKSRSRLKTESLKAATSTESISYDSESSEILQAIELSAVKLQLKTEDEADDHDGEMLKRIQRRQQKISVRERKCSERLAEILREEASQNLGQNADGDKCDEGLDATEFLDHNAELYGSGAVNLDASADGSGASNTFAPNADSSQGTQAWNGSGATQILGSHAGNSSTIWAGSTLSWDDSQTIESFGATTGSWRRRWNSSRFFRGTPAVRRNSWTGVSGTAPTELIEMSEMSVSAPATLCREGASNLQSLGNELLQILQTSFGCNPDEQSSETEQSSNHQSRRKATDYEDEGLRVGDSSIFYDLPQSDPSSSSLPTANTKTDEGNSLESRENSINEDKTNGKRMKLVSEVLQRTLWEETDRVIQENVLANMTKTDIALQESKFEILTSELSYLNSLNILVTVFMNCKELSSILSRSDEESLFKHIIKVKKASELFLYDLAGKWEDDIFLSGIYYEIEKHSRTSLKVYVDYCSNQVNLHRTLQRLLLEDDKFVELTNYLQRSSECFGNSLNSFLMLPMQRVTRLPLLLQTIERKLPPHSDERKECQLTLDSLHKLVHECNEAVRDAENESCIEDKYGHKKKLSLNALEPLTFTPKSSHRKWSLFNIREIKLNS